jgi:epoxyqueuosine reductase
MTYLNRTARVRADVRRWLPSARSVVVVANIYNTGHPHHVEIADAGRARIARYAWGDDYHDVMGRRLGSLAGWMRGVAGPGFDAKWCVDDGPVQEKVYAWLAGIGWIGKNTCIINPGVGSWLLLGVLACNAGLEPDAPAADQCGTCELCLDSCPAGAFVEPYLLDARRCLSYLTIEIRGAIPDEQRPGLGSHVFGCDICQDVCPWNRRRRHRGDEAFSPRPGATAPDLALLAGLDEQAFRERFRRSPVKRAKRRGLLRSVAVALGNAGDATHRPLLERLEADEDPVVREHAAWGRRRLDERLSRGGGSS